VKPRKGNYSILVHPMYSRAELNADSNYVLFASMIRAMSQVRPDWNWVMVFPDGKSGYKYEDDGLFHIPNVARLGVRMSPRKMANVISFSANTADRVFRHLGFDCVLSAQVETISQWARSGQAAFVEEGRPFTCAFHCYVIHKSLPYTFKSMEHIAFAQCMGAAMSDWNIFPSEYARWMFDDMSKDFLNDQTRSGILDLSSIIPIGVLEGSLSYRNNENPVPIIIYNHRLQNYKNYMDTFRILGELYAAGLKFKLVVTAGAPDMTSRVHELPFAELRMCATRDEYLKAISIGDLNVTNSQHETFCISAIESMALGQPLIAPDGITFPQITLRPQTGYPYLFKNEEEQKAMIIKLVNDKDERLKWGRTMSEAVKREFNNIVWAHRIAELMEANFDKVVLNPKEENIAWIEQNLRLNAGAGIREFWNLVACHEVNGKYPWGTQSLPMPKLVRLIRHLGGSTRIEGGIQRVYPE